MKKKTKQTIIVITAALIVVLGGATLFPLVTVYPATDYGDIALYNERTLMEMDATTTLDVQDGDWMVAWLRWNPAYAHKPTDEDFAISLRLEDGTLIENGRDRETYPATPTDVLQCSYRWWFDLDQCPQGTFTYYIKYSATIEAGVIVTGDSFSFQITNTEAPVYDDAVITGKPNDVGFDFGESLAYVEWTFTYEGPCVATVTVNQIEVDSQTYEASGTYRIFTYFVDTNVAGTFNIVFKVTPDDTTSPVATDEVIVTIAGSTTTTTTTDTTTTTPTTTPTTTTTTNGNGEEPLPLEYQLLIIALALGGLFFCCFGSKKR